MWWRGSGAIGAAIVTMEIMEAGLTTLSKASMRKGMSDYVFVVYSNALALLLLLISTFFYHRKRACSKLPINIVGRIFILGLCSCSLQVLMYIGIGYSSPTMASAMNGLVPTFTFLLAILFRMENVDLKIRSGQAKSIGTIVSILGAYIVIFYQGPPITLSQSLSTKVLTNWILGGFLLATSSFLMSLASIVQTWIIKDYSEVVVVTLVGCIFVTILSSIVALIAERDPSAWKLRPDTELLTIAYAAIFMVTIRSIVCTWACGTKGPVFVTLFKPLGVVFAVAMGVTFLRDTLHIGSVIGAAVITLGFYSVIWGKIKEAKIVEKSDISGFNSSSEKVPLLQNKSMEV